jgi:hypothetical protein
MMASRSMRSLAIAFVLGLAAPAWAACNNVDFTTWTAASEREARRCLTNVADPQAIGTCDLAICRRLAEWRGKPRADRVLQGPGLLDQIRSNFKPAAENFPPSVALDDAMQKFIAQLLAATPEALRDPKRDPFNNAVNRAWQYDSAGGVLGPGTSADGVSFEIRLGDILAAACAEPLRAESCNAALAGSGATVFHAALFQVAVTWFQKEGRDAAIAHIDMLDKRWGTYFDKSRVQFPWELAVNSALFDRELMRRRSDPNDPQGPGLSGPPSDQFIFLHPSVGLRAANTADRKLDQVVVLELAGYYRWTWRDAEADSLTGGSLIATWANGGAEQRKGYGFMVHMPRNYSIGLVQESGNGPRRLALVFSIDLGKLIQDPAAQKKKLLGLVQ